MALAVSLFLLTFCVSWVAGWVFAAPENHFLDAVKKKVHSDQGEWADYKISYREYLQDKFNAVPGDGTFADYLLQCRVCVGSYPGLAVSIISGFIIGFKLSILFGFIAVPLFWFGSVIFHYVFNLVTTIMKGMFYGSYTAEQETSDTENG